jgi:hypothetical protein
VSHSRRLKDDCAARRIKKQLLCAATRFTKGMVARPVMGGDSIGLGREKMIQLFCSDKCHKYVLEAHTSLFSSPSELLV